MYLHPQDIFFILWACGESCRNFWGYFFYSFFFKKRKKNDKNVDADVSCHRKANIKH